MAIVSRPSVGGMVLELWSTSSVAFSTMKYGERRLARYQPKLYDGNVTLSDHPLDSAGIPLPDGSWPDRTGSAGALEPVRRLCNSINREHGADAWRSVEELERWLRGESYDVPPPTRRDLATFRHLREALWQSVTARTLQPLADVAATVQLGPVVVGGELKLRGSSTAASVVGAELVEVILCAQHDGSWGRLKACQHCQWVFHDGSRNRAGRWCSMTACGSRQKARAYRQRQTRPATSDASTAAGR